jgi:hypothetical protein
VEIVGDPLFFATMPVRSSSARTSASSMAAAVEPANTVATGDVERAELATTSYSAKYESALAALVSNKGHVKTRTKVEPDHGVGHVRGREEVLDHSRGLPCASLRLTGWYPQKGWSRARPPCQGRPRR